MIEKKDRSLMLTKHAGRADMTIVAKIETEVGWPRLWDLALDGSERCVDGLKNLVHVITFPSHATSACPVCDSMCQCSKGPPARSCHHFTCRCQLHLG